MVAHINVINKGVQQFGSKRTWVVDDGNGSTPITCVGDNFERSDFTFLMDGVDFTNTISADPNTLPPNQIVDVVPDLLLTNLEIVPNNGVNILHTNYRNISPDLQLSSGVWQYTPQLHLWFSHPNGAVDVWKNRVKVSLYDTDGVLINEYVVWTSKEVGATIHTIDVPLVYTGYDIGILPGDYEFEANVFDGNLSSSNSRIESVVFNPPTGKPLGRIEIVNDHVDGLDQTFIGFEARYHIGTDDNTISILRMSNICEQQIEPPPTGGGGGGILS